MTSTLRKEILNTDDMEKAMRMIDGSNFTISTKNSLKCLWRKKHDKTIYQKRKKPLEMDAAQTNHSLDEKASGRICINIPKDISLKFTDSATLFVQKQLIHSQIELLISQEKAIDDMIYNSINEAKMLKQL